MKGVILAAGKGSRLYPVTHHIAKPLLPMANRTTLFYAFDRLKELGVTDVCVVVGENEDQMREALEDGSAQGVRLSYVRQTDPHGLAHAVGFAKEFVAGDPFVLYLGDAIYSMDAKKHAARFRETGAANLSLVKAVEDPRPFGVANTDGERIVKLVEKPQNPESNLVMAGMYFFGPQLWEVLPDLQPSARGEYEITDAIQMLVDRGHLVLAGLYDGDWFDTGTLDSYLTTTWYLTQNGSRIAEDAQVVGEIGDRVVIGEGARVACARIEDAVVLPGATVDVSGEIRHALVGGAIEVEGDVTRQILYGG